METDYNAEYGKELYWKEDYAVPLNNGSLLIPNSKLNSAHVLEAQYMIDSDSRQHGRIAEEVVSDKLKETLMQSNVDFKEARSYVEGGNILPVTRADGSVNLIIGRDSVDFSVKAIEESGGFEQQDIQTKLDEMEAASSFEQASVKKTVERLEVVAGIQGRTQEYQNLSEDEKLSKAKEYLAKRELAKEVIAEDFGVQQEDITFIDQMGYHIDFFTRPLAEDKILIHDSQKAMEMVEEALQDPGLGEEEKSVLIQYRNQIDSELQDEELQSKITNVKQQLAADGYEVIGIGGAFRTPGSHSREEKRKIWSSFLNAELGTTQDDRTFYLTADSPSPTLEKVFAQQLADNDLVDELHFIGGEDAKRAMAGYGGVDCLICEVVI